MWCSHQKRLNFRISDSRKCTSATSATATSNARSSPNVYVMQPNHFAAQCFQPCNLRMSATKRSATMRGVDTGSSQLRLRRGSSQSASSMVTGMSCFRAHAFLTRSRFLSLVEWLHDTLKITAGQKCTCADDTRTTTTTEILFITD